MKRAFSNGNTELVREKRCELRSKLRKARIEYKDKVEKRFCSGNAKKAWEGLNQMMGREVKQKCALSSHLSHSPSFVNDLNVFYSRFDEKNLST